MYKKILLYLLMVLSCHFGISQNYVEIGDGNETTYQPTHGGWAYSWMSTMYTSEELGGSKTITQIAFYRGFEDLVQWEANWDVTGQLVYMKITSDTEFSPAPEGGFYYPVPTNPSNGYTEVFSGSYNYGAFGWHIITLDTPFEYDGTSSLIVHWESRSGTSSWNLKWTGTLGSGNPTRSIFGGSDVNFPTTNGQMYVDNARTNVRFYYDSGTMPATPSDPLPVINSIKNPLETELSFTLGANTTNYDLYFGTDENSMVKVVDNEIATEGDYSYTPLSLLDAKTVYYWQVVAKNATDSESSPVWSFETEGAITDFPWSESFEEKWQGISAWWSSIINTNYPDSTDWSWDNGWDFITEPNVQDDSTAIYCSAWTDGEFSVKTPRIILPENQRISFWWKNSYVQSKVAGKDSTFFEITTDGGDNWNTLDTLAPATAMTEWENPIIDLSSYSGNNVYLRWRFKISDGTYCAFIDNIDIYDVPTGAAIELSETEIAFKDVAVNGYTKVPVIVRNTGTVDMDIASVSGVSPFSCDYTGTIAAGEQDTAYICFSPEAVGTYSETVTFNSNATGTNTIDVTGTGIALTGVFYETFDEKKEIPEGWNHIDSPLGYISGGGVQITSGTYDSNSEPYAAKILMSNDTVSPIVFLTPGVENFATHNLTFVAKKWDNMRNLDLQVGVMADPYDASSFVARQTFSLTDEFVEYSVSFKPSNTAPYIAFKHGGNPTGSDDWTSLRIDDVAWEANSEEVPLPAVLATPANITEDIDIMNNPVLTWTAGSSNTDGYYVYLGTSASSFDIINGEAVAKNPTNYEIFQALDYNTRYYWKIVPFNNYGSCADNLVWSFKTMQDPVITELPWIEDFDNVTGNSGKNDRPEGWSIENTHGDITWDILVNNESFDPFANSAPNSMHVGFGMNPKDDYLYSPPISLNAGNKYQLTYWLHTDVDLTTGLVYKEKLKVYLGSDNKSSEMTKLLSDTLVDHTDYMEIKSEFTVEEDGEYYIGFYAWSDPMQYLLIIDDVKLELLSNDAPEFISSPVESGKVDEPYSYSVETSDANNDVLKITATTLPAWITLTDNGDGTALLSGTPSTADDYEVELNVSDNIESAIQTFTINVQAGATGIENLVENSEIHISPNPASRFINITVKESVSVPYQLEIINIIGERIYQGFVDENEYSLELNDFDSGLYFVVIFDGFEKYTHKILIR